MCMDSGPAPSGGSRNDGVCLGGSLGRLFGRDAPAGAGDVRRGDVDVLLETHQLPVAGACPEAVAGLAGGGHHGVVGAQRIAEDAFRAERGGAAFQVRQQGLAYALALEAVVYRKSELEASGARI